MGFNNNLNPNSSFIRVLVPETALKSVFTFSFFYLDISEKYITHGSSYRRVHKPSPNTKTSTKLRRPDVDKRRWITWLRYNHNENRTRAVYKFSSTTVSPHPTVSPTTSTIYDVSQKPRCWPYCTIHLKVIERVGY